jgi:hypothetical protein
MTFNDDEFAELFKKLPSRTGGTSWQDVGDELGSLGRTFGDLLRNAWQKSENDPVMAEMRETVQRLIDDVRHAADGSAETQQAREQLSRLTAALRDGIARAGDDVRPELIELLRRANAELRRHGGVDN